MYSCTCSILKLLIKKKLPQTRNQKNCSRLVYLDFLSPVVAGLLFTDSGVCALCRTRAVHPNLICYFYFSLKQKHSRKFNENWRITLILDLVVHSQKIISLQFVFKFRNCIKLWNFSIKWQTKVVLNLWKCQAQYNDDN